MWRQSRSVCENGGGDVGDDLDDLVRDNSLVARVVLLKEGYDCADEVKVTTRAGVRLVLENVDKEDVYAPGDLVEEISKQATGELGFVRESVV